MKKIFFSLVLFGSLFFLQAVFAAESIEGFNVEMRQDPSGFIDVEETILYDFGDAERHGIFRTIPVDYFTTKGKISIKIDNVIVSDENNGLYKTKVSKEFRDIKIRVGDPDVFVSGVRTYRINYRLHGAVNGFENHDEIYWNVTGDEWEVPIKNVKATIILPQFFERDQLQVACFSGRYSSTSSCALASIETEQVGVGESVFIFEKNILNIGEGLTIVAGFPKGFVEVVNDTSLNLNNTEFRVPPPQGIKIDPKEAIFYVFLISIFPLLVFIFLFYKWYKFGKDPEGRGTIIAQFDVPDELSPLQLGLLIDEKANDKDIGAEIIYLAIKGYLKINRIEKKGLLDKVDYELKKNNKHEKELLPFQKKIIDKLFKNGNSVKLSDLKEKFITTLRKVNDMLYEDAVVVGYFEKNPKKVRRKYFIVGGVFIFVGFVFLATYGISVLVAGVIIMLFSFFMPVRTKKGAFAREYALGLKRYLDVAEKDRIAFHNAPEKNPKVFEKFLPYAMIFGVEKKWAKYFEGLQMEEVSWYSDSNLSTLSVVAFSKSLSSFGSMANATLVSVSAPAGGSGLSSGGSGGGFSGGGFGGGGGGSW